MPSALLTAAAMTDEQRGRRIRALREARGLSQQLLANVIHEVSHHIVHVNRSSVSRWEAGAMVRLGHRKALATALGVTVPDLWPAGK